MHRRSTSDQRTSEKKLLVTISFKYPQVECLDGLPDGSSSCLMRLEALIHGVFAALENLCQTVWMDAVRIVTTCARLVHNPDLACRARIRLTGGVAK